MKSKQARKELSAMGRRAAAAWLLAGALVLNPRGQVAPTDSMDPPRRVPRDAGAQLYSADAVMAPGGEAKNPAPLAWKRIQFRPYALYRVVSGNQLFAQDGGREDAVIQMFSPGLQVDLGPMWTVDYAPSWWFYSSDRFDDTLNHRASLNGGFELAPWLLGLEQTYLLSEEPLAETGAQTEREVFGTELTASRPIGERDRLDLSVSQDLESAPRFSSFKTWSTMNWWTRQFTERVSAGGGLGGGFVSVDDSPDMAFEQLMARVSWNPGEKVSASLSGGGEVRQFLGSDESTKFNPLAAATISYAPLESTELRFDVTRAVRPSLFGNQITESTRYSVGLRQRFLGRLWLDLGAGREDASYEPTSAAAPGEREDRRYDFRARLSTRWLRRGTAGIFFQWSDNESDKDNFSFESRQFGLDLSYRF